MNIVVLRDVYSSKLPSLLETLDLLRPHGQLSEGNHPGHCLKVDLGQPESSPETLNWQRILTVDFVLVFSHTLEDVFE